MAAPLATNIMNELMFREDRGEGMLEPTLEDPNKIGRAHV